MIDIKDKQLSRIITLRMCVENKTKLSEIQEISIVNRNFLNQDLNISLIEISKLEGIKKLSLKYFSITDEVIDSINSLENLETLEILNCNINSAQKIRNSIKNLFINNVKNLNISLFETKNIETLRIERVGLIDLYDISRYQNIERLELVNCQIISFPKLPLLKNLEKLYLNEIDLQFRLDVKGMEKLNFICLNGSKVENKNDYIKNIKLQNDKIKIIFDENNLPIQ